MPDSFKVAYTDLQNSLGEVTSRPLLTVEMTHGEATVQVAGLIDSGADVNVLPYRVGIALGLSWGEQRFRMRLSGNLANFDTRVVVVAAKVADFTPVNLASAWTQAEQAPLIFGQTNFFEAFNVCFFRAEGYFTIAARNISKPR